MTPGRSTSRHPVSPSNVAVSCLPTTTTPPIAGARRSLGGWNCLRLPQRVYWPSLLTPTTLSTERPQWSRSGPPTAPTATLLATGVKQESTRSIPLMRHHCARPNNAGAAVLGVDVVEFLDYPDGVIEYSIALRRDIAETISAPSDTQSCCSTIARIGAPGRKQCRPPGRRSRRTRCDRGCWGTADFPGNRTLNSVKRAFVAGSPESTHAIDVSCWS